MFGNTQQGHWLETIIVQQNQIAREMYGREDSVQEAAKATDFFTEDELERSSGMLLG